MQVKDRVLAALEASRGTYLSGQALAQQLQVSRNAVWKAISQLRESGYPIQAVSHRGYCLDVDSPLLSPQSIARHLTVPGLQVEVAQTVSSTNTLLRQRAEEGAQEGLVLAAVEQTAGKGRQGHSFFSPPDTGLYLSLLLRPKLSAQDALLLTTCAAAAVALAIEACAGVEAQIKWVNDVFCRGKKVCGILTEAALDLESGGLQYAIVGMGCEPLPPGRGVPGGPAPGRGGVHARPPGAGEPQPAGGGDPEPILRLLPPFRGEALFPGLPGPVPGAGPGGHRPGTGPDPDGAGPGPEPGLLPPSQRGRREGAGPGLRGGPGETVKG